MAAAPRPLELRKTIRARPDAVYTAFTDENTLRRWMSAWTGCSVTAVTIEAVVEGTYRLETVEKSGRTHYLTGRFVEVQPGRSLTFTWDADWTHGPVTMVTLQFEAVRGGTAVSVSHEGVQERNIALEIHQRGWELVLDTLQRGLALSRGAAHADAE